jgi:transposase-like protein
MDDNTFSALVVAHLVEALRLAVGALNLVDVPREATLEQIQALETARQDLEASAVTLLIQSGVTWEALARQLGVTRQSLHRRLSRRSTALQKAPPTMKQLEAEWRDLVGLLAQEFTEVAKLRPRLTASRTVARLHTKEPPSPVR